MTDEPNPAPKSIAWALVIYAFIFVLALGIDLLTDRSFGALMLAVLPMSLIALVNLIAGPWQKGMYKVAALRAWTVGSVLILIISIAFSLLGVDQAKTGELVFTYAAMIMSFPGSLVLPLAATWTERMFETHVIGRIFGAWALCAAAGWVEWTALGWLYARIQQQMRKQINVES